ncbi:ABC transporter substrate-binding protein [Pseudomonas saliphila]|uniref:ABC transporter substrate-binding protein n=1 Tax=Pseudomonas saliphila TaxID=2586906 RepID=UPI0015B3F7E0|nr:ABC transporter substrate-binding protein [Pseudomonas saliphila]
MKEHSTKSGLFQRLSKGLALTAGVGALALSMASQAATDIRFTLDWRFEGPSAPFLLARDKGYFEEEGLNVTIDSGSGSAGAVTRLASNSYDMGFADYSALTETTANNPGTDVTGVYMLYNAMPAAVFALKKSGISSPADLKGKTLGAPVFDGGRKAWPAFAQANGLEVDAVDWQSVEPALRETLLARGQLDGITGFYFTSLLNLESRGVKPEDIVALKYPDHGVEFYGNTIIARNDLLESNPEAVRGFLRALNRAVKETLADPEAAIAYVKKQDALIDEALELRRLKLAFDTYVVTDETRANGLGSVDAERLARAFDGMVSAYGLTASPELANLFDDSFLPATEDRKVD